MSAEDPTLADDALLSEIPTVGGWKTLGPVVLQAKLAQGGMGSVYRGHHGNLDIDVAVKCMHPGLAVADDSFVQRFQREARVAASLSDANLVRVFDVGAAGGLHYIVMEYVDGENLRQRVDRKGPLGLEETLTIARLAASGLAAAHRRGIVHRDIKPDNILVSIHGEVKVADLGLAKVKDSVEGMTATGMVIGTPQYMPPEQWERSSAVGFPGDVHSLGAVVWFMLAGRHALQGESMTEVMRQALFEPFPTLESAGVEVDEGLDRIVRTCTARNPADRYADAGALLQALEAVDAGTRPKTLPPDPAGSRPTFASLPDRKAPRHASPSAGDEARTVRSRDGGPPASAASNRAGRSPSSGPAWSWRWPVAALAILTLAFLAFLRPWEADGPPASGGGRANTGDPVSPLPRGLGRSTKIVDSLLLQEKGVKVAPRNLAGTWKLSLADTVQELLPMARAQAAAMGAEFQDEDLVQGLTAQFDRMRMDLVISIDASFSAVFALPGDDGEVSETLVKASGRWIVKGDGFEFQVIAEDGSVLADPEILPASIDAEGRLLLDARTGEDGCLLVLRRS